MTKKKKGKPTRSFAHVQEIVVTTPSKRMLVKHGNIDMGDPVQETAYHNTDLDLRGDDIDGVYTAGRKTHILFPPKTKCKRVLEDGVMKCKPMHKGARQARSKKGTVTDEERRERRKARRRERRKRQREERRKG